MAKMFSVVRLRAQSALPWLDFTPISREAVFTTWRPPGIQYLQYLNYSPGGLQFSASIAASTDFLDAYESYEGFLPLHSCPMPVPA